MVQVNSRNKSEGLDERFTIETGISEGDKVGCGNVSEISKYKILVDDDYEFCVKVQFSNPEWDTISPQTLTMCAKNGWIVTHVEFQIGYVIFSPVE